jgi:hypothetical protein
MMFSSSDICFYYFTIVVGRLVVRLIGRRTSQLFRQQNNLLLQHLHTGGEGAEVVVERRGWRPMTEGLSRFRFKKSCVWKKFLGPKSVCYSLAVDNTSGTHRGVAVSHFLMHLTSDS